jgi:hypothetical protein
MAFAGSDEQVAARKGAVLGSSNARRIAEKVDFADPCSPDSTMTG